MDPWGKIVAQCRGLDDDAELDKVSNGEIGAAELDICTAEVDIGMVEKVRREVPMKRRL